MPEQPWRNPRPAPELNEIRRRAPLIPAWLRAWWPALVWAGIIFTLSTDSFSASNTSTYIGPALHWLFPSLTEDQIEGFHHFIRKTAHFSEYFIFYCLLFRGVRAQRQGWRWTWALAALSIAAGYSALDEIHQAFVISRTASPWDSLLDSFGAFVASFVVFFWYFLRRTRTPASTAALGLLFLILPSAFIQRTFAQQQPTSTADATLKAAICPIVYPSDESPGAKGYRYTFFGNAFFINSQGYLVTAAHVLQTFRDMGQPYILVDRPNAPAQTLKANIIAIDWTHDVAILRAVPNPFENHFHVAFLPLAGKRVEPGDAIIASALHPANIRNASTYQIPVQDWSSAQVLGYVQTHEEPNLPETDLFLFTHEVQKGQSGSPVLTAASREVTGLVDGRWLRPTTLSLPNATRYSGPIGAAVPIDYLLQLLQKNSISWNTAPK